MDTNATNCSLNTTNCYWLTYCAERLPCGMCKITGKECYKKYQDYWPYTTTTPYTFGQTFTTNHTTVSTSSE